MRMAMPPSSIACISPLFSVLIPFWMLLLILFLSMMRDEDTEQRRPKEVYYLKNHQRINELHHRPSARHPQIRFIIGLSHKDQPVPQRVLGRIRMEVLVENGRRSYETDEERKVTEGGVELEGVAEAADCCYAEETDEEGYYRKNFRYH